MLHAREGTLKILIGLKTIIDTPLDGSNLTYTLTAANQKWLLFACTFDKAYHILPTEMPKKIPCGQNTIANPEFLKKNIPYFKPKWLKFMSIFRANQHKNQTLQGLHTNIAHL